MQNHHKHYKEEKYDNRTATNRLKMIIKRQKITTEYSQQLQRDSILLQKVRICPQNAQNGTKRLETTAKTQKTTTGGKHPGSPKAHGQLDPV